MGYPKTDKEIADWEYWRAIKERESLGRDNRDKQIQPLGPALTNQKDLDEVVAKIESWQKLIEVGLNTLREKHSYLDQRFTILADKSWDLEHMINRLNNRITSLSDPVLDELELVGADEISQSETKDFLPIEKELEIRMDQLESWLTEANPQVMNTQLRDLSQNVIHILARLIDLETRLTKLASEIQAKDAFIQSVNYFMHDLGLAKEGKEPNL